MERTYVHRQSYVLKGELQVLQVPLTVLPHRWQSAQTNFAEEADTLHH